MKLEWMGEYREVVEALIHYCNIYAGVYRREKLHYQGVSYSYAQIQVLEYLLENEERRENMSAIATRLGITRSNFTKIVQRLEAKGLVEKSPMPGSRREISLRVNDLGRALYEDYSREILRWHFSPMFRSLEGLTPEDRRRVRDALQASMEGSDYARRSDD
jgi:DNA-binding MarR family transcriptional regulator